jgi:hypothetical protein
MRFGPGSLQRFNLLAKFGYELQNTSNSKYLRRCLCTVTVTLPKNDRDGPTLMLAFGTVCPESVNTSMIYYSSRLRPPAGSPYRQRLC